jgi:hypothetical protein
MVKLVWESEAIGLSSNPVEYPEAPDESRGQFSCGDFSFRFFVQRVTKSPRLSSRVLYRLLECFARDSAMFRQHSTSL